MSNKQQTAVEWLVGELDLDNDIFTIKLINYAKELESEHAEFYATYRSRCINEGLPIIAFDEWIKLKGGTNEYR